VSIRRRLMAQARHCLRCGDRAGGRKIHGFAIEEEAVIVDFRMHTLQPAIPHLTRSSLQRHCISRLPEVKGDKLGKIEKEKKSIL
jgi:hypothetical protein